MSGKHDKKRKKARDRADAKRRSDTKERSDAKDTGEANGRADAKQAERDEGPRAGARSVRVRLGVARSPRKQRRPAPRRRRSCPTTRSSPERASTTTCVAEEAFELGLGPRVVPPHFGWSDPLDVPAPGPSVSGDVAEQIRALEARLDGLIRGARPNADASARGAEPSARRRLRTFRP